MRKLIIVIASLLISLSAFALQEGTYKYYDGNFWEKMGNMGDMGKSVQLGYLIGLKDGYCASRMGAIGFLGLTDKNKSGDIVIKLLDFYDKIPYGIEISVAGEQLISGIDQLYQDYANRHIPVFAIATVAARRISGKLGDSELQKWLQILRSFNFQT